jgi:putative membrane protein
MNIIYRILFAVIGVMVAAYLVPGIVVAGIWTAVLVAIVLGILNVTIGALLKFLTLPLSIVTFGFFFLVVNALMFWAASFVKGFYVAGFWPAFFGSIVVTVVSMIGRRIMSQNSNSQWN